MQPGEASTGVHQSPSRVDWHPKLWTHWQSCKGDVLKNGSAPVDMDPFLLAKCLASALFGSAPGRGEGGRRGTYEMQNECLEDAETLHFCCCKRFGKSRHRSGSPEHSWHHNDGALEARWRSARDRDWDVLLQTGGQNESRGSRFALSTRARTDCVGHATRAMTDANLKCAVLFIVGVGAYDHVLRSSFFSKLHNVPSLQELLPFVRSTYARTTTYVWEDGARVRHRTQQAEGEEQGDRLMPQFGDPRLFVQSPQQVETEKHPLHIWMTCTFLHRPTGHATGTISLKSSCWQGLGSNSTKAKTRVRNHAGTCPAERKTWPRAYGAQKGINNFGHADLLAKVRAHLHREETGIRGGTLKGSDVGPRSPKRVANSFVVCWPTLPPPASHTAIRTAPATSTPPYSEHTALHRVHGPALNDTLNRAHGPALSMWPRMERAAPALNILPCIEHTAFYWAHSSDLFRPKRFGPDRLVCSGQYRFTPNHFGAHNALIGPGSAVSCPPPQALPGRLRSSVFGFFNRAQDSTKVFLILVPQRFRPETQNPKL